MHTTFYPIPLPPRNPETTLRADTLLTGPLVDDSQITPLPVELLRTRCLYCADCATLITTYEDRLLSPFPPAAFVSARHCPHCNSVIKDLLELLFATERDSPPVLRYLAQLSGAFLEAELPVAIADRLAETAWPLSTWRHAHLYYLLARKFAQETTP